MVGVSKNYTVSRSCDWLPSCDVLGAVCLVASSLWRCVSTACGSVPRDASSCRCVSPALVQRLRHFGKFTATQGDIICSGYVLSANIVLVTGLSYKVFNMMFIVLYHLCCLVIWAWHEKHEQTQIPLKDLLLTGKYLVSHLSIDIDLSRSLSHTHRFYTRHGMISHDQTSISTPTPRDSG